MNQLWNVASIIPNRLDESFSGCDQITWKLSPSGLFLIKSTWNAIHSHSPKVSWFRLVWFSRAIPKFSFILWLLILDKLPIQDKLFRFGIANFASCPFCELHRETTSHLFFLCQFLEEVWSLTLGSFVPPKLSQCVADHDPAPMPTSSVFLSDGQVFQGTP